MGLFLCVDSDQKMSLVCWILEPRWPYNGSLGNHTSQVQRELPPHVAWNGFIRYSPLSLSAISIPYKHPSYEFAFLPYIQWSFCFYCFDKISRNRVQNCCCYYHTYRDFLLAANFHSLDAFRCDRRPLVFYRTECRQGRSELRSSGGRMRTAPDFWRRWTKMCVIVTYYICI